MRPSSSRPPTSLPGPRPKSRKQQKAQLGIDSANASEDVEELNFRVKDRQNPVEPKGILDTIKETVVSRGPDQKFDMKETLKRPLTGLFRRRTAAPPAPAQPAEILTEPNQNTGPENAKNDTGSESPPDGRSGEFDDTMSVLNLKGVTGVGGLNVGDFNIDLSFLTRLICLESDINEEQEIWTWDALFASVSAEIREEMINDIEYDDDDTPPHTIGNL